jgi:hypothetical protein
MNQNQFSLIFSPIFYNLVQNIFSLANQNQSKPKKSGPNLSILFHEIHIYSVIEVLNNTSMLGGK